jgi:hypothetical protein
VGRWKDVTRLVDVATARAREVACCLKSSLMITGTMPVVFGGG